VAVLLPFSGPLQSAGEALRDGLLSAQFENLQAGEPGAQLRFFDSAGAPLATVLAQALAFQPDHIIGPLTRDEVATLNGLAQGQETTTPPILALNRLPAATPAAVWSYALEPEEEGEQLAEQSWLQGHRRLLILHDQAPWAQRLASAAETRFERLGGEIAERQGFSATADLGAAVAAALLVEEGENRSRALRRLLRVPLETEPRRRQDIDGVLLIADPLPGQTLKSALAYYFAGDLPVWASSQVLAPEPSPTALKDLEAVTFALPPWRLHRLPGPAHPDQGAKPVPESPPPLGPLHALGADAWFLIHWQRGAAGALPFPGLTGQIANTEQPRRFSRHLSFAQLREGRFSPLAKLAPLAPLTAAGQSETAPRLPAP
jgi:outer membrane PBP1 activator LpoA protein